ncbi:class I SAM-dependent methyltransferase [Brachybacterium sp. GCM10030268]|uniref:class I SAM-dependent methyltransferase n=1 Tax=Brachybacterium sp. GCM10030268 TaxID=3273382 RepID=UPI00361F76E0
MTHPDPDHGGSRADVSTPAPADRPAPAASGGPDQTDRVILRTAADEQGLSGPGPVLVLDDVTGELTAAALAEHAEAAADGSAPVISWAGSDATTDALRRRFRDEIAAGRLQIPGGDRPIPVADVAVSARPHLALMRLPKALADLEHRCRDLAGAGEVTLVAGGRVKHMTRSQNEVLARVFAEVHASRGLGKSRALVASSPREHIEPAATATGIARVRVRGQERDLAVRGIGGVFGGASADAGSLLLLEALDRSLPGATGPAGEPDAATTISAIDLGSGNGLLTAYLAAALPAARVLASDDDADAVASTRATLAANGLARESIAVTWDASLSRVADGTADLVVLNPPFHAGTAIDATLVHGLLDAAARVLRPGGQLWFVHNSYLRYRPEVEQRVGPVRQQARDRRFTVLSATRA